MAAYQSFDFGQHRNNMTVVDMVRPEMLHLIDPHWFVISNSQSQFKSVVKLISLSQVSISSNEPVVALNSGIRYFHYWMCVIDWQLCRNKRFYIDQIASHSV